MRKPYVLLAIPIAFMWLAGCHHQADKSERSMEQRPPVTVKVLKLAETEIPDTYAAPGTIRAMTSSALSSKLVAYVQSVDVHEGEHVRAGQRLIVLNSEDLEARYRSAQSSQEEATHAIDESETAVDEANTTLDLTQKTFNRLKDLYDKRSISDQEFDEASGKLKSAQLACDRALAQQMQAQSRAKQMSAELRSAEITRGYAIIAAPFSGIVTSKSVDPGVLASPGMPLITLERADAYRLEATVEESRLNSIHVGDHISVQIDALKKNSSGVVAEIVPLVDAASRTYTVKVDLPRIAGVHSGLFGRALFPMGQLKSLLVPCDAVSQHGDLASVLVADGGFARRRLVTTGSEIGSQIVVLSGLVAGDAVIYPVPPGLQDGASIEVKE